MNGRARGSRSGWLAKVAVIVPVLVFVSTEPVAAQVQRLTGEDLDILVGPEPVNGWPLIRGREFPHCI